MKRQKKNLALNCLDAATKRWVIVLSPSMTESYQKGITAKGSWNSHLELRLAMAVAATCNYPMLFTTSELLNKWALLHFSKHLFLYE